MPTEYTKATIRAIDSSAGNAKLKGNTILNQTKNANDETSATNPLLSAIEDSPRAFSGSKRRMTFIGEACYRLGLGNVANDNVISSVLYFQSPLQIDNVEEILRARLCKFERFRSKLVQEGQKLYYQEVDTVDFSYHLVQEKNTMPADELDKYLAGHYLNHLDPNYPLWRFHLLTFDDGRGALVARIHHCIADGSSLMQVLLSLMDKDNDGKERVTSHLIAKKREIPSLCSTILKPKIFLGRLWTFVSGAVQGLTFPVSFQDSSSAIKIDSCLNLSTSKNISLSIQIPLEDVKKIKCKINGSVNDVIVGLITGTIRRYLKMKDEDLDMKTISRFRGIFPLNTRKSDFDINDPKEFGNKFTMLPIDLPISISDRKEMLLKCKKLCDKLKVSPLASIVIANNKVALSVLPSNAYTKLTKDIFDKPTVLFTNVCGPSEKVSFAGQLIDDIRFVVPGLLGLTIGIISYNGNINVGITCDPTCIPDVKEFDECFLEEFSHLKQIILEEN